MAARLRLIAQPWLDEVLPTQSGATSLRVLAVAMAVATAAGAVQSVLLMAGRSSWQLADKTGAAKYGTRNDIAILRRAEGAPIVIAIMSSKDDQDAEADDDLVADATRVAVAGFGVSND